MRVKKVGLRLGSRSARLGEYRDVSKRSPSFFTGGAGGQELHLLRVEDVAPGKEWGEETDGAVLYGESTG